MSDLLGIGASGVRAYGAALAAVGNNVSNANTAGYTRRTVTLQQNTSADSTNLYFTTRPEFGGVVTTNVTRAWDDYQATTARTATSDAGQTDAYSTWMSNLETALGDGDTGVGKSATAVFNAGDALAADVNSSANRQAFLSALDQTATAFNTTATALKQTSDGIGQSAQTAVSTINSNLDTLDKINAALARQVQGSSAQANLEDQRDQVLDSLSAQVGINVTLDAHGVATVKLAGSNVQLTGGVNGNGQGTRLTIQTADNGRMSVQAFSATASYDLGDVGGNLGGLVQSASVVADRRDTVDQMAGAFASAINNWQAAGQTSPDSSGNSTAGAALLSGTSAATIKLAVSTTDTSKIAVASSSASNGNLLTLSALRTSTGVEQSWTTLVTNQGQIVSAAKTASTAAASTKDSALQARDTTSGVDLDTEAAELLRYQQAYSGAAKVIQTAKDTMQSILDLI